MIRQLLVLAACAGAAFAYVVLPTTAHASGELLSFSRGHQLNLGDVGAGRQDVRFVVNNVAGDCVQITRVSGSCTCMDIQFDGGRLMPGESRECLAKITVQPNAFQSTAVFFDVASPRVERYTIMVLYRGVQRDCLDAVVDPDLENMEPDGKTVVAVTSEWRTEEVVKDTDQITWKIEDAVGVKLLSQREESRSPHSIRAIAYLELDAASYERVSAIVDINAGRPVRARARRRLSIPVLPSLRVVPDVILLEKDKQILEPSFGDVSLELTNGWRLESVATPDWITAEVVNGRLVVRAARRPPFRHGVASVNVVARSEEGQSVSRRVQCVVDLQE